MTRETHHLHAEPLTIVGGIRVEIRDQYGNMHREYHLPVDRIEDIQNDEGCRTVWRYVLDNLLVGKHWNCEAEMAPHIQRESI